MTTGFRFDYICACCRMAFKGLCGVNDAGTPYCTEKCFNRRATPKAGE